MSSILIAGLFSSPSWKTFIGNEFNRGFVIGFVVAAVLALLFFIVWMVLSLTVFSHRASEVIVSNDDGDIEVSRTAIAEAIELELGAFPELKLLRVRLFKDNPDYRLILNCEFKGASGLLDLAETVRPRLKEALQRIFGVESIRSIGIVIESYTAPKARSEAGADGADKAADTAADKAAEKTVGDGDRAGA